MLVKDLIKELEKLPQNATIGIIHVPEMINGDISVKKDKKEVVYTFLGREITVNEIEKSRLFSGDCAYDYYIV